MCWLTFRALALRQIMLNFPHVPGSPVTYFRHSLQAWQCPRQNSTHLTLRPSWTSSLLQINTRKLVWSILSQVVVETARKQPAPANQTDCGMPQIPKVPDDCVDEKHGGRIQLFSLKIIGIFHCTWKLLAQYFSSSHEEQSKTNTKGRGHR